MSFFLKILSGLYCLSVKQLDPDQARHSVGPDLSPNYLHSLSQTTKVTSSKERVKYCMSHIECINVQYLAISAKMA